MAELRSDIEICSFSVGDATAFRTLNEEWISSYFVLEPTDVAYLSDPQKLILDKGGKVFFATKNGDRIGCCALLPKAPDEYEISKMAVAPSYRGAGIGRRLLQHTIGEARALGARRLYLETNSKLTPAIRLYESLGFVLFQPNQPSPYTRANVFMEMWLRT